MRSVTDPDESTVHDEFTVREALDGYFEAAGFPADGGYTDKWVKLQVGGVFVFAFPNNQSRIRAVRFHDVHHVATGYATTWTGEAEIGAWEIASGCADHTAAWILNLYAMALGLCFAPRAVYRAFVRGRHSRNCYCESYDDELLDQKIGPLRERLGLRGAEIVPRPTDRLTFVGGSMTGLM
ncbi:MAG: hypothetical protein IH884_13310, partial [Myxococcales bacterium]|nr:hypothetical protein [Myxococcales bacterium]